MIQPTLSPRQQNAIERLAARINTSNDNELNRLTLENQALKKRLIISRSLFGLLSCFVLTLGWQADTQLKNYQSQFDSNTANIATAPPNASYDELGYLKQKDKARITKNLILHKPIQENVPEILL